MLQIDLKSLLRCYEFIPAPEKQLLNKLWTWMIDWNMNYTTTWGTY